MDTEIGVALILGGFTAFTSLLIIGVTVIFKTKSFEDEYENKVEKIKLYLQGKMDGVLVDFMKSKLEDFLPKGIKQWKKTDMASFSNLLDEQKFELVNTRELDPLFVTAVEYDAWVEFISDCKKNLRKIGMWIIIVGIAILSFVGIINYFNELAEPNIGLLVILMIIPITMLISKCSEYHENLKKVDETYNKLQSGWDI